MRLDRCVACELPVLELHGQFAKLDSFYVRQGTPPLESAGYWHVRCLRESSFGPAWHDAFVHNFTTVRSYARVADLAQWTVVRNPRSSSALAIGRTGELLELPATRKGTKTADGGVIARHVEPEFHLELEEVDVVREVQSSLRTSGTYPIVRLLGALGIAERIVHPEALADGAFHFENHLTEHWQPDNVSARLEYGVFIPAELVPHIGGGA